MSLETSIVIPTLNEVKGRDPGGRGYQKEKIYGLYTAHPPGSLATLGMTRRPPPVTFTRVEWTGESLAARLEESPNSDGQQAG